LTTFGGLSAVYALAAPTVDDWGTSQLAPSSVDCGSSRPPDR